MRKGGFLGGGAGRFVVVSAVGESVELRFAARGGRIRVGDGDCPSFLNTRIASRRNAGDEADVGADCRLDPRGWGVRYGGGGGGVFDRLADDWGRGAVLGGDGR